ncbi:MAG TPA: DUF5667 domain-containing protein [Chloroflexota bacterium]|nr:DUF5667 domain-containing protein [Chloroflexota bacterium]
MKSPADRGGHSIPHLDTALDLAVERLRTGASFDECLTQYPQHASELRPLLELASIANQLAPVRAPGDVKARARARLWAAMEAKEQRRPWWQMGGNVFQRLQPAMIAACASAFLLFGSSGALVASAGALPGDRLYPVKLAVEEARLATVAARGDEAAEALLRNELAQRRIEEANALAQHGRPVPPGLIEAAVTHERAADVAASQAPEPRRGQIVSAITRDGQRREEVLQSLLQSERVPAPAQTAIAQVLGRKAEENDVRGPKGASDPSDRGRGTQSESRGSGQAEALPTPEQSTREEVRDDARNEGRGSERNEGRGSDRSNAPANGNGDDQPRGQGQSSREPEQSGRNAEGRDLRDEQQPTGRSQGEVRQDSPQDSRGGPTVARGQGNGNQGNGNQSNRDRSDELRGNGNQGSQGNQGQGSDNGRATQSRRPR